MDQMNRNRILLISVLFSILTVSMFWYAFWNSGKPVRLDTIPSGAYNVPWMQPNPSIEELNKHAQGPNAPPTFNIDTVMTSALKLNIDFEINISSSIRDVQGTVYLGHDSQYLYVGGKFVGMYMNPTYVPGHILGGSYLQIMFDVDNSGTLRTPEAGSRASVAVGQTGPEMLFYYDMAWIGLPIFRQGRPYWEMTQNLQSIGFIARTIATVEGAATYENKTGTLQVLFERLLSTPSISSVDALQMRSGERWVMGFLIEMGFENPAGEFQNYVDGWPRTSYPYTSPDSSDSSWWPKLAIDLSNPPTTYPGVAA